MTSKSENIVLCTIVSAFVLAFIVCGVFSRIAVERHERECSILCAPHAVHVCELERSQKPFAVCHGDNGTLIIVERK